MNRKRIKTGPRRSNEGERGPTRFTRLYLDDDAVVNSRAARDTTPSAVIAELVHKGLLYEQQEQETEARLAAQTAERLAELLAPQLHPLATLLNRQSYKALAMLELYLGIRVPPDPTQNTDARRQLSALLATWETAADANLQSLLAAQFSDAAESVSPALPADASTSSVL